MLSVWRGNGGTLGPGPTQSSLPMSETKPAPHHAATAKPARATLPLVRTRRILTMAGVALAVVNIVMSLTAGSSKGGAASIAMWAAAAACFFAAFIVFMTEPTPAGEKAVPAAPREDDAAKDGSPLGRRRRCCRRAIH